MNTMNTAHWFRRQDGSTMLAVLMLCTAILIVSGSIFSILTTNRKINHKAQLLSEAREGAEAALALATAEIDRRATNYSSFGSSSMTSFSLSTSDQAFVVGASSNSNLESSNILVKPGAFNTSTSSMTLNDNDPVYRGDDSKGITASIRTGIVYAKASTKDPLTGQSTTAYASGTIQLRERSWFNYGFFYNMDMEFHPGPVMDIYGAVHTNADMYLSSCDTLNLRRMVTAAGHIYHGLKYCIKGFNADGSAKGFQDNSKWTASSGRDSGKIYITSNGSGALKEMGTSDDCLGTKTNPTDNLTTWRNLEDSRWNKYIMDKSWDIKKFSPPGLPLYVPENYGTAATELRNTGYALIEPQLPTTDNKRYYGRKTVASPPYTDTEVVENMKFSALAGLTIVVEDLDLAADSSSGNDSYGNPFYNSKATSLKDASLNGTAIPWKLVWYKGATNASNPVSSGNTPKRSGGVPEIAGSIDPFDKNDEVDFANGDIAEADIKMQRNLKALLRDAIVVVPYKDDGSTTTYGTGATDKAITGFPSSTYFSFTPVTGTTRYNQLAGSWPMFNAGTGVPADAEANLSEARLLAKSEYAEAAYKFMRGITESTKKYPATSSTSLGRPILTTAGNKYYGMYDRRQGYVKGTNTVGGLQGAMCAVYIDLQKLDWILSKAAILATDPNPKSNPWLHPKTGAPIYAPDTSYTNIIYVDLPSVAKDSTRFALTDSDKICHAAPAAVDKPGYCVILKNGSRLPRLPYNDTLRTPGFTFATNGPVYIVGNFNADGLNTTGNTYLPDSDVSTATSSDTALWYGTANPNAEVSALVAADAVTFLTDGFDFYQSNKQRYDGQAGGTNGNNTYNGYNGSTTVTTANFQEVSTALILGLVPTIPYLYNNESRWSGGVNNLPRFLENLSGITYCYRGSMAALYESEVANAPFFETGHSNWFSPPSRAWGYHQFLAAGLFAPGTYVIRTARLIDTSDISAATYNAAVPTPPAN